MSATNKLNIYLIKSEYGQFDQVVEDGAMPYEIEGIGTFYAERSNVRPPDWLADFFGDALPKNMNILVASSKGVLLVNVEVENEPYIFAVTFGTGRTLLKDGVFEERFGLKVVLNTVDHESLRSLDKTTLGSIPKQSREQMSKDGVAANFGIDIEQDLIKSVTGKSRDGRFGNTISGRDSLSLSIKIDVTNIKQFLEMCVGAYKSETYKENFGWIDQIKDVRNKRFVETLDALLLQKLVAQDLEKVWMAVPDVMDWVDIKGFKYLRPKKGELKQDLDVREFLQALNSPELSVDVLKKAKIHAISARSDDEFDSWNAYKCIYAEIEHDEKVFILNNGKWYEIIKDFTLQVKRDFDSFPEFTPDLIHFDHQNENEYNTALATALVGSHCMDRQMISHGGGHSKIEFCDVLTHDNKLLHIKRYAGSSQLSHLFSQGVVSAELFVSDEEFRRKLNDNLPDHRKLADVSLRPDPGEYEIVFGIISRSANPLEIPFFSKVSLKNARRRLQALGYNVSKKKIQVRAN